MTTKEATSAPIFKTLWIEGKIEFRLATPTDLPLLEWGGEYSHFRQLFQYTLQEQSKGRRLMLLAVFNCYPIGQVFVHLREEGFLFNTHTQRGYLYALRVMTPFQRLGLGTTLVELAEKLMQAEGLRWSSIAVAKENAGAKRLYERLGYRVYAEDEGRWSYTNQYDQLIHVHEPCWMLEKALPPPTATSTAG